jgi:predicted DNA-binding transcriptional regulator YafY
MRLDRGRQLVRTHRVLWRLVCGAPCSINELARMVGVCGRTIRRDIDALQAAGFPLVKVNEDAGDRTGLWRCLPARDVYHILSACRFNPEAATSAVAPAPHDARRAS